MEDTINKSSPNINISSVKTSETELFEILEKIIIITNKVDTYKESQKKYIVNYILESLQDPLDAIGITEQVIKNIPEMGSSPSDISQIFNTIGLCLALRYKKKIPIEVTCGVFKKFKLKSISDSRKLHRELKINKFVIVILSFINNIEIVEKELNSLIFDQRKFASFLRGTNVYYFIIALLLDSGKNDWNKLVFLILILLKCINLDSMDSWSRNTI